MTDPALERREPARPRAGRPWFLAGIAALVVALAGGAALYGMATSRNAVGGACAQALPVTQKLAPLAKGEVAALAVQTEPRPLPDLAFRQPDGTSASLAALRGRTVLLNLWATWCAPCRKEMPALDALQAALGGPDFTVAAVNIDTRNTGRAGTFLDEIKVAALARYADPTARIFQDLKAEGLAFGMPTTLLLDPKGCLLASLAGPADWSSDEARTFIRAALGKSS